MQSFLDTVRRPVVHFDPTNVDHRMHMALFLKNGTWAKCPYVFYTPNDINVRTYATEVLLEYYLEKEFAKQHSKSLKLAQLIDNAA